MFQLIKNDRGYRMSSRLWLVLMAGCLGAAAMLRTQNVSSEESGPSPDDDGLDYFCVGEVAVAFHEESTSNALLAEAKPTVRFSEARRRCRPPLVPLVKGSVPIGSGMSFRTGYGGMLSQFDGTKETALAALESALVIAGWRETPASKKIRQIKTASTVRMFERAGAWLLAVAVTGSEDAGGDEEKSAVFFAGQWRPDILEKLK